jgi:hypothetical protein
MALNKSLDENKIIAALLFDVHKTHEVVFDYKSYRLTLQQVRRRLSSEGFGFLSKTLPKLAKALDRALSSNEPFDCSNLRFSSRKGTKLPRFLGEFFERVLLPTGYPLQDPCVTSVGVIRQVCYLFYKYELPYSALDEQEVINQFERTEDDLLAVSEKLNSLLIDVKQLTLDGFIEDRQLVVVRKARSLLKSLFASFDPTDIDPGHGPGVVATKQKPWAKFRWTNISDRISEVYPKELYFYSSIGHYLDRHAHIDAVTTQSFPARVILVPKDSRGPRLISCEPVDFQWIQHGLGGAIVRHVEHHNLTRFNVFFTDQGPNQRGALLGSLNGKGKLAYGKLTRRYTTLDLKEASDRVSLSLVRLLFEDTGILPYLEACRTTATVLPSGKVLELKKFAPMGSSLCFPVLALTIWAILTASAPDQDTRDSILVYGDDVVVPEVYTSDAIHQLESFGLKVNHDKSCSKGFFRESCGMDAFQGFPVTPLRLRTVWTRLRSPESYVSWIDYSNRFRTKYKRVSDLIGECLVHLYGPIPDDTQVDETCPRLTFTPHRMRPLRTRNNSSYQRLEYFVWCLRSPRVDKELDGWEMFLRYQSEKANQLNRSSLGDQTVSPTFDEGHDSFRVREYTQRRTSMLVRDWR